MAHSSPASQPEMLIQEWLREDDRERARALMSLVMGDHAEPLIRRIVSFKLTSSRNQDGGGIPPADVEDVCSTAVYNLLTRFERLKAASRESPIQNFNGYAAATAYNACNEYFRARKPAWLSLAMKIRYLTTHAPEFGLWQNDDGQEICGFASARMKRARPDVTRLTEAGGRFRRQQDPSRVPLGELVTAILKAAGGPLVFEELVGAAADWSGLKEVHLMSLDEGRGEPSQPWEVADRQSPADTRLIDREYMRRLWTEILDLPLEHRKTLLLNLDDSGGGDIQLFDALGVASIEQIATALEMNPLEFAELWNRLPLDDASLARHLEISRQDVANRRSSARKRLARRMKEFAREN